MAMLRLTNDPDWIRIGGRFLIPVHDELIVEVPFDHRKEGADILKRSMENAGSFLPFPITCDIEETFRWYGLSVEDILSFEKPKDMNTDDWSESNIKWLQCRLIECEYILPLFDNPGGSKPIGLAAHGVNGVWSEDVKEDMIDYMRKHKVTVDDFLDDIDRRVVSGS